MNLCVQTENGNIDKEWVILIQTAQKMGIPMEEVRGFLETGDAQENKRQRFLGNSEEILSSF